MDGTLQTTAYPRVQLGYDPPESTEAPDATLIPKLNLGFFRSSSTYSGIECQQYCRYPQAVRVEPDVVETRGT